MADVNAKKLGSFLTEVSNWDWREFVLAEHDNQFTSNQAVIFGLVRACAMQKMDAIKMSLERIDGKLKTPVQFEYPKIYYVYPNAKLDATANDVGTITGPLIDMPTTHSDEVLEGEVMQPITVQESTPEDLPSLSLRETVDKMSDYSQEVPELIIQTAIQVEEALRNEADMPPDDEIPKVKSVISAHLLTLAQNRNIAAVGEVFDQIDGRLAETIQLLGEDLYITNYSATAPENAYINADGLVEAEAVQVTNMWAEKLAKGLTS